ncbi:maleylpyruvate isomerase N-terminal domain-containing protein [Nocardia wallacei]|uniref:maleylpyruvate isomerase N-terminal domain-containing protein n=1 Tax=Nocardia wallacei TaxID=480035 RepID=UPI002455930F|nr:maleylpyruvate isomerase N-terminal domain-containing protein [Nocardia wallacei]
MIDLKPACHTMIDLLEGISGFQLCLPTPCTEYTVRNLVSHIAETARGASELVSSGATIETSRSAVPRRATGSASGPADPPVQAVRAATADSRADGRAGEGWGVAAVAVGDLAAAPPTDYLRVVAAQVRVLGMAWDNPAAWVGTTEAGGLALPNEVWGKIAFTEMVVHGWDLATALGRPFRLPEPTLRACLDHVTAFVPAAPIPALWGAPVTPPPDATLLDRILTITGRDPHWVPAAVA